MADAHETLRFGLIGVGDVARRVQVSQTIARMIRYVREDCEVSGTGEAPGGSEPGLISQ